MRELLKNEGLFGSEIQRILNFYRSGVWTADESVQELTRLVNSGWISGSDVGRVLFWALQNSVD